MSAQCVCKSLAECDSKAGDFRVVHAELKHHVDACSMRRQHASQEVLDLGISFNELVILYKTGIGNHCV